MTLLIGLDGGGTGSRARALRDGGEAGAVFEGGSANIHSDPDGRRTGPLLPSFWPAIAPAEGP